MSASNPISNLDNWPDGALLDQVVTNFRPGSENWHEDYAYTLGVQAYIYGFPWIYLSQLRWLWTTEAGKALAAKKGLQISWAPINTFFNSPTLATPAQKTGGSPNHDTLYSVAWLDVGFEPVVLSVPEITDRFYCFQMASLDSDNFAYVGTHTTGTAAGNFLIGGPGWQGTVQDDVLDVLPRSRTPAVLIFGRTGVNNSSPADLAIANGFQAKYRLTTLSSWTGARPPHRPERPEIPVGFDYNDTRGAWITMNRAMTENPPGILPGIGQAELLKLFATIGVGPGHDLRQQSPATIVGLQRAARDALARLKQMAVGRGISVNNWHYPPRVVGRAGQASDFITRAAVQALAGIADHDPSEAVYINTTLDFDGENLVGSNSYTMTFDPGIVGGGFPPFDSTYHGFWSVTMYQSDFNLVTGSESYFVNSYYPEFQDCKDDGSITIVMQRDKPTQEKGVYWLQTPAASAEVPDAGFYLILRVYVPGPEVAYTQTWAPPPVLRAG